MKWPAQGTEQNCEAGMPDSRALVLTHHLKMPPHNTGLLILHLVKLFGDK